MPIANAPLNATNLIADAKVLAAAELVSDLLMRSVDANQKRERHDNHKR